MPPRWTVAAVPPVRHPRRRTAPVRVVVPPVLQPLARRPVASLWPAPAANGGGLLAGAIAVTPNVRRRRRRPGPASGASPGIQPPVGRQEASLWPVRAAVMWLASYLRDAVAGRHVRHRQRRTAAENPHRRNWLSRRRSAATRADQKPIEGATPPKRDAPLRTPVADP